MYLYSYDKCNVKQVHNMCNLYALISATLVIQLNFHALPMLQVHIFHVSCYLRRLGPIEPNNKDIDACMVA